MTPTDNQIVKAVDGLRGDVQSLKLAAYVLDEYVNSELKSSHVEGHPSGFEYLLGREQVSGMVYMLDQVRVMAASLEFSIDKAFEPTNQEAEA